MNKKLHRLVGLLMVLAILGGVIGIAPVKPVAAGAADADPAAQTAVSWTSGWVDIAQGQWMPLAHDLGGDPTQYGMELWFYSSTEGLGVHRRNYGGLEFNGSYSGAYWYRLNESNISIFRYENDNSVERVRVTLWIRPDSEGYQSEWMEIDPGETLTINHNLNVTATDLTAAVWFRSTALGIHHVGYGGIIQEAPPEILGAYWHNLTDNSVQVTRGTHDDNVEEVMVMVNEADPPAYDSMETPGAWDDLAIGAATTFHHNLNVDINTMVVRDECYDPTEGGYGIHQRYAGGEYASFSGWQGVSVQNLTETDVDLVRRQNDLVCPQGRVRIWLPATTYLTYLPLVLKNSVATEEWSFDDGAWDSWQSNDLDAGFAVRFPVEDGPVVLQSARFYLDGATGTHPIDVHVWDVDRNDLITPIQVTPPAGMGWYSIDLTDQNLTLDEEFYLGFVYLEASFDPSIGVDYDPPISGNSYEFPWEVMNDRNYMIHAVVTAAP
ncbi:MAG: hypothetical protein JW726_11110 [Anaerolineales bacterium]|nr:hypothetical protein [Anaerolineales bacterium]